MREWRERSQVERDAADDGPSYEVVLPPGDADGFGAAQPAPPLDINLSDATPATTEASDDINVENQISQELIQKIIKHPDLIDKVVAEQTEKLNNLNLEIDDLKAQIKGSKL
jgi:hypothetical protein